MDLCCVWKITTTIIKMTGMFECLLCAWDLTILSVPWSWYVYQLYFSASKLNVLGQQYLIFLNPFWEFIVKTRGSLDLCKQLHLAFRLVSGWAQPEDPGAVSLFPEGLSWQTSQNAPPSPPWTSLHHACCFLFACFMCFDVHWPKEVWAKPRFNVEEEFTQKE